MRKNATLVAFVLASVIPLIGQHDNAQDSNKGTEEMGIICNADNVTESNGKSTCDERKNGKSADWVFIDQQGNATTIANPQDLKGEHGKVMVHEEMRQDKVKHQERMWIYNLQHISSGM